LQLKHGYKNIHIGTIDFKGTTLLKNHRNLE